MNNMKKTSTPTLDGMELFLFAVKNKNINSFDKLILEYATVFPEKNATRKRVIYPVQKIVALSDEQRENVFALLKEQDISVEEIDVATPWIILKKIFQKRRHSSNAMLELKKSENQEQEANEGVEGNKPNSEVAEILDKYSSEVQKIFMDMVGSKEDELKLLTTTYDKYTMYYHHMKGKDKRELIMDLLAHTYVATFEELATLLDASVEEILSLFKGKNPLKKRAMMLMGKSNKVREERRRQTSQNTCFAENVETPEDATEKTEVSEDVLEETPVENSEEKQVPEEFSEDASNDLPEEPDVSEEMPEETNASEKFPQFVPEVSVKTQKAYDVMTRSYRDKNNNPEGENWRFCKKCEIDEYSSNIHAAKNPREVLLDTNILMDSRLRSHVEKNFVTGAVSMMSIIELKKLLKTKRSKAIEALSSLMESVSYGKFYKPVQDINEEYGNCDIRLALLAKQHKLTFITKDMGAAVYAWSIGCACRYLRMTEHPAKSNPVRFAESSKVAVIDAYTTKYYKLAEWMKARFGHCIVTDMFAERLNNAKTNDTYAVTALQQDICTDTDGFYEAYQMSTEEAYQYEKEMIDLCKKKNATLVSSDPVILAMAWQNGVDTYYYH